MEKIPCPFKKSCDYVAKSPEASTLLALFNIISLENGAYSCDALKSRNLPSKSCLYLETARKVDEIHNAMGLWK